MYKSSYCVAQFVTCHTMLPDLSRFLVAWGGLLILPPVLGGRKAPCTLLPPAPSFSVDEKKRALLPKSHRVEALVHSQNGAKKELSLSPRGSTALSF